MIDKKLYFDMLNWFTNIFVAKILLDFSNAKNPEKEMKLFLDIQTKCAYFKRLLEIDEEIRQKVVNQSIQELEELEKK